MKNLKIIEIHLSRIEQLLRLGASDDWIKQIESLRKELFFNPASTRDNILGIYAGMGSFNDIVLYNNGQLMIAENIELDELRAQLYKLCRW